MLRMSRVVPGSFVGESLRSLLKSPYPQPFLRSQGKGVVALKSLSACGEGLREGRE